MCNRENLDNLSISAESLWKRCVKSQHYDFILHQAVWHQEGFSQYAENLGLEGEKICDMAWNLSLALMRVDPLHLTSSTSRLFMSHLLLVLYFENISIIFYNGLYDIGINLNAYMILLGLYIYISYFQYLLFFTCTCFSTSFPKQNNRFFHNSSKDCWCDASSSLKRLLVVKRVPNCRRWKAWSHGENSFVKTQPPKKR